MFQSMSTVLLVIFIYSISVLILILNFNYFCYLLMKNIRFKLFLCYLLSTVLYIYLEFFKSLLVAFYITYFYYFHFRAITSILYGCYFKHYVVLLCDEEYGLPWWTLIGTWNTLKEAVSSVWCLMLFKWSIYILAKYKTLDLSSFTAAWFLSVWMHSFKAHTYFVLYLDKYEYFIFVKLFAVKYALYDINIAIQCSSWLMSV